MKPLDKNQKKQPATPVKEDVIKNNTVIPVIDSAKAEKLFWGSLVIMLIALWIFGFNSGFHSDEMDLNNYTRANLKYYATSGKDTSFMGGTDRSIDEYVDPLLKYYGSAFEYLPVIFNKATGLDTSVNEYNSRHIFIQIFAIVGILFTGLLAKRYAGYKSALIVIWLMYLTPMYFGHAIFNSKDIPFCTGSIATLYFIIRFLDQLPNPKWSTTIGLLLAFGFTAGTRLGGVINIMYFGIMAFLYLTQGKYFTGEKIKQLVNPILKAVVAFGGAITIIILSWPYLLVNPGKHFFETLNVLKKFPLSIKITFNGTFMDSLTIPPDYLPRLIVVTLPIIILFFIIAGIFIAITRFKQYDWKITFLILFTCLFPAVYAIATKAALYSGWRHFLFIYPGLAILGSLAVKHIYENADSKVIRIGFIVLVFAGMVRPVMWMIKNHPNEYTYYNEFTGGFQKAYYNFETDYWAMGMKDCVDWAMKHEPILQSKDTVYIASNMEAFVRYYIKRHYPKAKVKTIPMGCLTRYGGKWSYAFFNNIFLRPEYLENFFPPCQTIYSYNIDEMPVNVVLKDTVRLDLKAQEALTQTKYQLADSLLGYYLNNVCPSNVGLYGTFALIKADLNQPQNAIQYAYKCLEIQVSPFSHYDAHCALGVAYGNQRLFDSAILHLNIAKQMFPKLPGADNILNQVLMFRQRLQQAGQQ